MALFALEFDETFSVSVSNRIGITQLKPGSLPGGAARIAEKNMCR